MHQASAHFVVRPMRGMNARVLGAVPQSHTMIHRVVA